MRRRTSAGNISWLEATPTIAENQFNFMGSLSYNLWERHLAAIFEQENAAPGLLSAAGGLDAFLGRFLG